MTPEQLLQPRYIVDNTIRVKIFALYLGCFLLHKEEDQNMQLLGVNIFNEFFTLRDKNGYIDDYDSIDKLTLLLKPLSDITDEDKKEVLSIIHRDIHRNSIVNPDYILQGLLEPNTTWCDLPTGLTLQIIDHLRSKDYMLPAYGITDLFDAGIAINTQTLTENK